MEKTQKTKTAIILTLILIAGILLYITAQKTEQQEITGLQTKKQQIEQTGLTGITGMITLKPTAICNITSCVGSLNDHCASGDTVNITQDLTLSGSTADCLIADISDITIDCNGHKIIGDGTTEYNGIFANTTNTIAEQLIIQNCEFQDFNNTAKINTGRAIKLETTQYVIITNNTFNNTRGIYLNTTENTEIENNSFVNYNLIGVPIPDAQIQITANSTSQTNHTQLNNNNFEGINHSSNRPYAIYAEYANNLTIEQNTIQTANLILLKGIQDFLIKQNTLSTTEIDAITDRNTINGRIQNNSFLTTNTEIKIKETDQTVKNISIYDHINKTFRILTYDKPEQIFIFNNSFIEATKITLYEGNDIADNCTIYNNIFYPTKEMQIVIGTNSVMRNNQILNGEFYTITVFGDNTTVRDNIFTNIIGRGIVIKANNATVTNNTFNNITGTAIVIGDDTLIPPAPQTKHTDRTTVTNNTIHLWVNMTKNTTMHKLIPNLPYVPSASTAIFVLAATNNTNISGNKIYEQNVDAQTPPNMLKAETRAIYGEGINNTHKLENLWIHDNTIDTIREGITLKNCETTQIYNNQITRAGKTAIKTNNCTATIIHDNTLEGGTYATNIHLWYKTGIELFKSRHELLENNIINNYRTGIHLYGTTNTTTQNDTITNNIIGILSYLSTNNKIQNNTIKTRQTGIKLFYTNHTQINQTNITNEPLFTNTEGIILSQSHNNNITNNNINTNITITFDHNSAYNNATTNTLTTNAIHIIFDLFANNNNGTGNIFIGTGTNTITKNFAHNNSIT